MVRIAVRIITLSVFRTAATNPALTRFICERSAPAYFDGLVRFMCRYLEQINRAFLRLRSLQATDQPPATSTKPGPGFVASAAGKHEAEPAAASFRALVMQRRDGGAGGSSSALQTLQQVRNRLVDLLEEHVSQLHYMDDVLSLEIAELNAVLRAQFLEGLVRRNYLSPLFKRLLLLETPPVSEKVSQNPTPSHTSPTPLTIKQETLLKSIVLPTHKTPTPNQLLVESSFSGSHSAPSSRSPSAHDISKVHALRPQQQQQQQQKDGHASSSISDPEDALALPATLPEPSLQMSAPLVLFLLAHLFFNVEHSPTLSDLLDVLFAPVGSTLLSLLGREPQTPGSASALATGSDVPLALPRSHSLSHVQLSATGDRDATPSTSASEGAAGARSGASSVFSSVMSSVLGNVVSSASGSASVSASASASAAESSVVLTDSGNEMIELQEYRSAPGDTADTDTDADADADTPRRRHSSGDVARASRDPHCPYCNSGSCELVDGAVSAASDAENESESDANITDEEKLMKRAQRERRHRLVHQRLVFDLVLDYLLAPIVHAEQQTSEQPLVAAPESNALLADLSALAESSDQSALYVLCLLYALLTNARNRGDFVRRLDAQASRQMLYVQLFQAELQRLELGTRRPSYRALLVLLCLRLIKCVCSTGSCASV